MKETYNPEQHIDTDISQKEEKTDISPSDKTWEEERNYDKEIVRNTKIVKELIEEATIKAKTEYKEAILGEIDGMFDGYMGVETITINELEGIMKKQLEEPNSCR